MVITTDTPTLSDGVATEEQAVLRAALDDFNTNPLATIERVFDYNANGKGGLMRLSGAGKDGEFIRSCSWRLNKLLGTDKKKAKGLYTKLESILDGSSGNVMFHVWCDVDRLTATK